MLASDSTDDLNVDPDNVDRASLSSDTFWDLIDKLLLKSTCDEKRRQRHNAALSAVCRGRAVTCEPRKSTQNNARSSKPSNLCDRTSDATQWVTEEGLSSWPSIENAGDDDHKDDGKDGVKGDDGSDLKEVARAQSDSLVSDSSLVYIKDESAAPVCERLWRFAIRNRKQLEDTDACVMRGEGDDGDSPQFVNAQNNEETFRRLQQQLDEAKAILEEDAETDRHSESSNVPSESTHDIQQASSDTGSAESSESTETILLPKRHRHRDVRKGDRGFNKSFTRSNMQRMARGRKKSTSGVDSAASSAYVGPKSSVTSTISEIESDIKPDTGGHGSCDTKLQNLIDSSEDLRSGIVATHMKFNTKKTQYDKILRSRLSCGNRLETLSKTLVNRDLNPRTTLSRDTMRTYSELKAQYLKLTFQEASLRHQIAILQAEIYTMQNKAYHKQPATVKTITLDPTFTKLASDPNNVAMENVMLFPRLRTPRRLIFPHKQQYTMIEEWGPGYMKYKASEAGGRTPMKTGWCLHNTLI